ncbi:MAG: isoprenyl transferase [Clostridiales bacterium]|nr:isoprenyl transferase [Clostridiales bacterium]
MIDIKLPNHVGIIMDGNGRWAKAHKLPRVLGHNAGMESMKKIVKATSGMGIKYLTVYAFSTENWKRSTEEVSGIFKLIVKYVNMELKELDENNVHINIMGEYDMLPKESVEAIDKMLRTLEKNDGLIFNIALNYGGRDEILKSVKTLYKECIREGKDIDLLTEEDISRYLYSGTANLDIPDPDLIIRTSGEERMSNFLTWQSAYSELIFTETLWPDFSEDEYRKLLEAFSQRKRRFGGRNEGDK